MKEKSSELFKYTLFAMIIGVANLVTFTNFTSSLLLVILEMIVLGFFLLKQRYDDCYVLFLIFLCMSFEFNQTTGSDELYGFKAFEIAGINLAIIFLVVFILLFAVRNYVIRFWNANYEVKFIKMVIILGVTGIVNGGVCLLLNDNEILKLGNTFGLFFGQIYLKFIMVAIFAIASYIAIHNQKVSIERIKRSLVAILIGAVFTMIMSMVMGKTGRYGGVDTLQIQNVVRYTPFLYVYSFSEERKRDRLLIFIIATVGTILTLMYNATGKMILLYVAMPIAAVIVTYRKNKRMAALEALILPGVCLIVFAIGISKFEGSVLFSSKLREVVEMFKFGEGWLENMPVSPRARIAEFINIVIEYTKKPLFCVFGKGYIGTTKDHLGLITNILGGYTDAENMTGAFYGMHESINILFLTNGLLGLVFVFRYIGVLIKGLTKSMHYYSALFWLVFSYGFSVTMSGYGITALMVCLYELSVERERKVVL